MRSSNSVRIVLVTSSVLFWVGCSSNDPVAGRSCRTDQDCNGGLCQAGVCTEPVDGGWTPDAATDPDAGTDGDDVASETGDDVVEQTDQVADGVEDASATNACGGTEPLEGEPGDPCGVCADGELVCDGPDALICESATPPNVCGGCGPLPGIPGAPCGDCEDGLWMCEDGDLVCSCDAIEPNGTCEAPFIVELGSVTQVDLCGAGDEHRQIAGPEDCRTTNSRGEEVVFALELEETTTVVVDLRDDDDTVAIDTIVYIRSDCGDEDSQLICSDDVLCESSDFDPSLCTGPVQVRQSHIEVELEAGTYYVIADSFNYTQTRTFGCGTVRLSVGE